MVGEDADVAKAEVDEDLGADAGFMLDHALAGGFAIELAARVNVNLGKLSGFVGLVDAEAAAGVMEIEKRAAIFFGDSFEGAIDEIPAIAGSGAEDVSGEAVRMDADESGRITFEFSADERDVLIVIDIARIGDHAKFAKAGGERGSREAANVAFMLHAVANEIGDGEQFQIVLFAEFDELRHARHGAILAHDFADDAGGSETGDASEVDARFGLACANEDAAVACAKREDMTRTREVLRTGFGIDGGEDGDGAVGGADACGDADARVDGFGKCGAVNAGVDRRHEREVEVVAAIFRERHADEAAAELGHEVDGFGRDFFGGHGEVAFVFAVLVIDEDDHAAVADFFDGLFDSGEVVSMVSHRERFLASHRRWYRKKAAPRQRWLSRNERRASGWEGVPPSPFSASVDSKDSYRRVFCKC